MSTVSLKERLHREPSAVDTSLAGIDSLIRVCAFACRAQDDEVNEDVATVFDAVYARVQAAQASVIGAVNLLPDVASREGGAA